MHARGHGQQVAEFDVRLARVVQREGFGQVFLGEDLGFEPFGNLVVLLLEHDAAGDAGVRLADRGHRRQRFAIALAVIFLVDQIAVARHQQPAVLAAAGGIVEGPVELLQIHARRSCGSAAASFSVRQPPAVSGGGK